MADLTAIHSTILRTKLARDRDVRVGQPHTFMNKQRNKDGKVR